MNETRFYLIRARTLEELPEYSCSMPTGTTIGKTWKRDENAYDSLRCGYGRAWWIGRYEEHPDPAKISIRFYFPIIVPDWHFEGVL